MCAEKLQTGKGIVATVVGSSFVHETAGCFHTSLEALWSFPGVVPQPNLYPAADTGVAAVHVWPCSMRWL